MTVNKLSPTRRVQPIVKHADPDNAQPYGYLVFCPGCKFEHLLAVREPNSQGAQWSFNGDLERPTFSPSLLVHKFTESSRCHSFIRDGKFNFLIDCAHPLAGSTVDVPTWLDSDR